MRKPTKWSGRLDTIAELAALGTPDGEIGERWGVDAHTICEVRAYHGIPTNSTKHTGYWSQGRTAGEPPPRKIDTVTRDGVTYCSPAWATGATSDHRVRPRRK